MMGYPYHPPTPYYPSTSPEFQDKASSQDPEEKHHYDTIYS